MRNSSRFVRTYPLLIGGNTPPMSVVSAGFTLPGLLPGQVSSLASGALRNQSRMPVLIDEIRLINTSFDSQPQMGIELRLGNVFLTRDFAPYNLFGARLGTPNIGSVQTWRLPEPLFLVPGEEISARFMNLSRDDNSDYTGQNFNICLVGRALEECSVYPSMISVPYLTWYATPWRQEGVDDYIDESNDTDLVNPFDSDMKVQRFVGAVISRSVAFPYIVFETFNTSPSASLPGGHADNNIENLFYSVSMVDHLANPTIRNAAQWDSVFSALDRSWLVNTKLPPKGYYLATVNAALDAKIPASGTTYQYQALIGMIGSREVRLG